MSMTKPKNPANKTPILPKKEKDLVEVLAMFHMENSYHIEGHKMMLRDCIKQTIKLTLDAVVGWWK